MYQLMMLIHILGAVALGFYMLLPFVMIRLDSMGEQAKLGLTRGLYSISRICQFALIVQLITGGYIMSQAEYTTIWMAIVIVLLIVIGAFSGIMNKKIKNFFQGKDSSESNLSKATLLSWATCFSVILIIITMVYPMYA